MEQLHALKRAIINGESDQARALTEAALANQVDPVELVTQYMSPAMAEVGQRFECEEFFVPELILAARAMKSSLELVRPLLAERGSEPVGRVVIGTVQGDLHDIGKNLVASMLEGGGFEVYDLGCNVTPQDFITKAIEKKADIIALSALLTTTMPTMKAMVDVLKEAGLRERVKLLVGGAPVTESFADNIGADGYSDNAAGAVSVARKAIGLTA